MKGSSKKAKGDLLEELAKKLLTAQNFEVIEEIRIVGAELDLLPLAPAHPPCRGP